MANDIDKIIDDFVMPEMEYVKTKQHTVESVKVPEVVLPKTKAEMYKEAQGRLKQKTSAVSKAYKRQEKQAGKKRGAKSGESEVAATAVRTVELTKTKDAAERKTVERKTVLARISDEPRWVGGAEELIPFAWRYSLVDVARPSKLYRVAMRDMKERESLLPAPR